MAETTADVKRDIELTRERMSSTLSELEQRLDLVQVVKDNPWTSLAVAFGAGLVLAGTGADRRAAEATTEATKTFSRSAGGRVGPAVDGLIADLITGVRGAFEDRVESLIGDVRVGLLGAKGPGNKGSDGNRASEVSRGSYAGEIPQGAPEAAQRAD